MKFLELLAWYLIALLWFMMLYSTLFDEIWKKTTYMYLADLTHLTFVLIGLYLIFTEGGIIITLMIGAPLLTLTANLFIQTREISKERKRREKHE